MDQEKSWVLEDIPKDKAEYRDVTGHHNCWVTITTLGNGRRRLEIFPDSGGWLGVDPDLDVVLADVAPFHS